MSIGSKIITLLVGVLCSYPLYLYVGNGWKYDTNIEECKNFAYLLSHGLSCVAIHIVVSFFMNSRHKTGALDETSDEEINDKKQYFTVDGEKY